MRRKAVRGSEEAWTREGGGYGESGRHNLSMRARLTPAIGIVVFFYNRWAASRSVQVALTAVSISAGMRVLWLVNKTSYVTVMEQGPAVGTLWIMTIVLLPLAPAVLALAVVGGWSWWKGMKVQL